MRQSYGPFEKVSVIWTAQHVALALGAKLGLGKDAVTRAKTRDVSAALLDH